MNIVISVTKLVEQVEPQVVVILDICEHTNTLRSFFNFHSFSKINGLHFLKFSDKLSFMSCF